MRRFKGENFMSALIIQTKKLSDLEKRIKLLRQQVYGKQKMDEEVRSEKSYIPSQVLTSHLTSPTLSSRSDISYLRFDLLKILTLSSLAIGVQIILFVLSRNHILNLNFF